VKYPKIQTVYKRDPATRYKTLLEGEFSIPEFEYLADNQWLFTEKIDGMNIRVGWDCDAVRFAGRTDRAQVPPFLLARLKEMFPPAKFPVLYPETAMVLYGEGYGAKIQKGGGNYIPDGVSFILFDVLVGDCFLRWEDVCDIAVHLEIETVPVLGRGTLLQAVEMARRGFKSLIGDAQAEGVIMRPAMELLTRRGQRIIAKIKRRDFA